MARPAFPKNLREFQSQFATEDGCRSYLAACRWPDGFVCPQCGNRSAHELTGLRRWQCVGCRRQDDYGHFYFAEIRTFELCSNRVPPDRQDSYALECSDEIGPILKT